MKKKICRRIPQKNYRKNPEINDSMKLQKKSLELNVEEIDGTMSKEILRENPISSACRVLENISEGIIQKI